MGIKYFHMLKHPAAALLLAALLPAAAHCTGKPGAIILSTEGEVLIKPDSGASFLPLRSGDLLYAGDTIKTGPGGRAAAALRSGAEVRLNENTVFVVYPKKYAGEMLQLKAGQIWTRLLKGHTGPLYVATPSAICAIRGTEADIMQRGGLLVKVYEGSVVIRNSLGRMALAAGQMSVVVRPDFSPQPPKMMSPFNTGRWQQRLKLRNIQEFLQKLAAYGGRLGREMVGAAKKKLR